MHKTNVLLICALVTLAVVSTLGQDGSQQSRSPLPAQGERVLVVPWRVSGTSGGLLCTVSEYRQSGGEKVTIPTRILTVENQQTSSTIYKLETQDAVISAFPLGDYSSRLLITLAGGSAYHFHVLAYVNGNVKEVLDAASKLEPEIVFDREGHEMILVTQPVIEQGQWSAANGTTDIFGWTGDSYRKIASVAWRDRLTFLTKEGLFGKRKQ